MKVGRRLAMKVLNVSKFVLGATGIATAAAESLDAGVAAAAHVTSAPVTEALDKGMLAGVTAIIEAATLALEAYDHTRGLEAAEQYFWTFCDDYVELVKERAYDGAALGEPIDPFAPCSPEAASARAALTIALDAFLRLFAPVLPFAAEEVWSWFNEGSIHRASWPTAERTRAAADNADPLMLVAAGAAVSALRKIKSDAKVSQRTAIVSLDLLVPENQMEAVNAAKSDIMAAGRVKSMQVIDAVTAIDPSVDGMGHEDGSVAALLDATVVRTENVVLEES
jgi:valyl-tRNA synthetase